MSKRKPVIPPRNGEAVNRELTELGQVKAQLAELKAAEDEVIQRIRTSFRDAVVVFIDMVGSTQFKVENSDKPETWIRRVFLFCDIISKYVEALGGRVVKYIGDEVMAVFESEFSVNDASSLVARIDEIEAKLMEVIGVETRIKIAIDKGSVCFLKFEGHDETDPQGTPVDRCARIAKHTKAGVVLASHEFVVACPKTFTWLEVRPVEFRGIGSTMVYQMGEKTVDLTPLREVREDDYQRLQTRVTEAERGQQHFEMENQRLIEMNEGLQNQIREIGQEPDSAHSVTYEEEDENPWSDVQESIEALKEIINEAPAPATEYARFLFLDRSGYGDRYNSYERSFDASIEAKLVYKDGDGFYHLDHDHRRNNAARSAMSQLEDSLSQYDQPEDELFNYSLDDPEFWHKKLGYYVQ